MCIGGKRYVIEAFYPLTDAFDNAYIVRENNAYDPYNPYPGRIGVNFNNGMLYGDIQVLGEYQPTVQPIVQQTIDFDKILNKYDNACLEYKVVYNTIKELKEELNKMCCNCNNQKNEVFFDLIEDNNELKLSPDFLKKSLATLTPVEVDTMVNYYSLRIGVTYLESAVRNLRYITENTGKTVQQWFNWMF